MKTEEEIKQEKEDFKKAGKYDELLKKENGKLKFSKTKLITLGIGVAALMSGLFISGELAFLATIPTVLASYGIFSSKIKKAYYKKRIEIIQKRFENVYDKKEELDNNKLINKENIKQKFQKRINTIKNKVKNLFNKEDDESDFVNKEKTEEPSKPKKTVKNLQINTGLCNAIFNEDGTYSMNKEQLKYLNTVQDKEIMNKQNINKICMMYGKDNTNTNPKTVKILKKVT